MQGSKSLAVFILAVAGAAWFGAHFEPGSWYASLERPPLAPPNWIFAPVWSLLYLAIAVAGWLVWRSTADRTVPLALWVTQLALNALWSLLFFGLERPGIALVEILVLLLLIVSTAFVFFRIHRLAGWLLAPYAAWVAFASYLNAGFWFLNR